ncbi:MAG TPA: gluconokinase [Fibrobacteria bacterium]|nr:gluconokinase [Fibrobacteria bacterium]
MAKDPVKFVVVIGVTGCGKSTLGRALAAATGWDYLEGDAFHGPLSLSKMVRGVPLTDLDRLPWLERLAHEVRTRESVGRCAVLACSALKESYRTLLREAARDLAFVHLDGPRERIAERLAQRVGHFADGRLLPAQFAAWEPCPDALVLDAFLPVEQLVAQVREKLDLAEGNHGKSAEILTLP